MNGKRGKGSYALIDERDLTLTSGHSWHLNADGYAAATVRDPHKTTVLMSRIVMGLASGDPREVDHKNRNKLDNRRSNLRIVSRLTNINNVGSNQGATSQYRGVSWSVRLGKWVASFRGEHILVCDTEIEAAELAARARELAAEEEGW